MSHKLSIRCGPTAVLAEGSVGHNPNTKVLYLGCTILSCMVLLIPAFLNLEIAEQCSGEKCSKVYEALTSQEFLVSLVAALASSIPITIDYVADIPTQFDIFLGGNTQRVLLLFSLLVPDCIVLGFAIPSKSVTLLVCMFHLRSVLVYAAIATQLMEFGAKYVSPRTLIIVHALTTFAEIAATASAFTLKFRYITHYCFLVFTFLACVIITPPFCKWFRSWWRSVIGSCDQSSLSDMAIAAYWLPGLFASLLYILICASNNGNVNNNTSSDFLCAVQYTEAILTVSIFFLQGRLNKVFARRAHESLKLELKLDIQKVCAYSYSHSCANTHAYCCITLPHINQNRIVSAGGVGSETELH